MGHRLSKIYTRTGDAGTTGLGDGSRTAKNSARVAAMGDVDELNRVPQWGHLISMAVSSQCKLGVAPCPFSSIMWPVRKRSSR